MEFIARHLDETKAIVDKIDAESILKVIRLIINIRENGGRLFFLGVGGSAGNASHAVNDFRKIAGIESYAPTDNISELTARTNDDGWASVFVEWLKVSRLNPMDGVFVFSVGGGDVKNNVSPNLVKALEYAKTVGSKILGIVGRNGGFTAKVADACVVIPTVNPNSITPHAEAFQGVVWHLIVSHPEMQRSKTKWESVK